MPSKIEASLTPEQFWDFCSRVAQMKGGRKGAKLADIQKFAEEWGIIISLNSAMAFRDGAFADYLADLRGKAEMAQNIATVAKHGLGLADAAAVKLAIKINDDLDKSGDLSVEDKGNYSLAISRLRTGDQRSRYVEHVISKAQFDAATAVIEHAPALREIMADKQVIGPARTERVRKLLFGDKPADFKPVTTTGAQTE